MNSSIVAVSLTKVSFSSQELWKEAVNNLQSSDDTAKDWNRYVDILAKKGLAGSSSVQDANQIQDIATQMSERCKDEDSRFVLSLGGRTASVRKILENTIDILAKVKDLGSAVASLNPYASLAWSGVQFFVSLASTSIQVRRLCYENLPRVLELTVRYITFTSVYEGLNAEKTAPLVREALLKLFVTILRYHIHLVVFANSRSERMKAVFANANDSEPSKIISDLKASEESLDIALRHAQFESISTWTKDLSADLNLLRDISQQTASQLDHVAQIVDRERQNHILQWISPVLYEDYHKNQAKTNMTGTGNWLLQHHEYKSWKKDSGNAIFWLRGFMGSGKSCLTHAVIDDVKSTIEADRSMLAYIYCDRTTPATQQDISSVDRILRCIVKQLAQPPKSERLMNEIVDTYNRLFAKAGLTTDDCIRLIRTLADQSTLTTIIIDGLDECPRASNDVQWELIHSLTTIMRSCFKPIHIFVSSRPEQQIYEIFKDKAPYEISTEGSNLTDIKRVIRAKVEESAAGRCRRIYSNNNPEKREAVIKVLAQGALGMFRWVELAIAWLHKSTNAKQLTDRLNSLPKIDTLDKMYDEMYADIKSQSDGESEASVIDAILRIVMYSAYDEFRESFNYAFQRNRRKRPTRSAGKMNKDDTGRGQQDKNDKLKEKSPISEVLPLLLQLHLDGEFVSTYTEDDMLDMCPGLISRGGAGQLTIPHASVIQYFEGRHASTFSHKAGHAFMASICIQRLQISESRPLSHLSAVDVYCASFWSIHLLEIRLDDVGHELVSSSGEATAFGDNVDEFLTGANSDALVAEAGKVVLRCLNRRSTHYTAQPFNMKSFPIGGYSESLRTSMIFSPGLPVGTLPMRIALNYKLKDLSAMASDEQIIPYGYRDLTIYGCAAFTGNLSFLELLLAGQDQGKQIDWEEVLIARLPRLGYSEFLGKDAIQKLQRSVSDAAIFELLEHYGVYLDAKFKVDEDDEDPWTFLRCVLQSEMMRESKIALLQRLPKDCLRNPPFPSFRRDMMRGRRTFELIQPFVEEVRNDASIMSELLSYATLQDDYDVMTKLILMSSTVLCPVEFDVSPSNADRFPETLKSLKKDVNGRQKLALFWLQILSHKIEDDTNLAWPISHILYGVRELHRHLRDLIPLDHSDPAYVEIINLKLVREGRIQLRYSPTKCSAYGDHYRSYARSEDGESADKLEFDDSHIETIYGGELADYLELKDNNIYADLARSYKLKNQNTIRKYNSKLGSEDTFRREDVRYGKKTSIDEFVVIYETGSSIADEDEPVEDVVEHCIDDDVERHVGYGAEESVNSENESIDDRVEQHVGYGVEEFVDDDENESIDNRVEELVDSDGESVDDEDESVDDEDESVDDRVSKMMDLPGYVSLVRTKISSVRDWKAYFDKLSAQLELKIARG